MSDTQTDTKKNTFLNIIDGLNTDNLSHKFLDPAVDYVKSRGKPYYVSLMFTQVIIILLLLVILFVLYRRTPKVN